MRAPVLAFALALAGCAGDGPTGGAPSPDDDGSIDPIKVTIEQIQNPGSVRGAVAATAELDGETVDQGPVTDGRFTLVAVDAVEGFGDDLFLEVKLWNRAVREIAGETLYEASEDEPEPEGE